MLNLLKVRNLFLLVIIGTANYGFARDGNYVPTAFIKAGGGLSTYKSKMVDSNDTSTLIEYSIGAYAGLERDFGMIIRKDQATTPFSLNDSSILTTWQDYILKYRYGPVYLGAVLGSAEIDANKEGDAEYLKARGSGYGLNLGFMIPVGKYSMFNIDVLAVSNSTAVDLNKKEVGIGQRLDYDINASFDLTKSMLDFVVGYKYRTYSLTVEGEGFAELFTTTYIAFVTNFYF